MSLIYRPIDVWPGPLTERRAPSPFDASWKSTLELLDRECGRLQGVNTRDLLIAEAS